MIRNPAISLSIHGVIVAILRTIAIMSIIGIIIWDRHSSLGHVIGMLGTHDWLPLTIIGIFVIVSLILVDHLIWKIIVRITHPSFAKEILAQGVHEHATPPDTTSGSSKG